MDYRDELHLDEVASVLRYDHETGKFYWIAKVARNVRAGSEAGVTKATRKNRNGEPVLYRYIRYKGFGIPAAQIAWLLYYKEWPVARVSFNDGDPLNLSIDNLRLQNGVDEKFDHSSASGRSDYFKAHRKKHQLAWKETHLQQSFGISLAEYGDMLVAQNGKCAICNMPETQMRDGRVKALSVDHNHDTGAVRGLLCSDCNTGIGKLKDDPEVLRSAIRYLERSRTTADQTDRADAVQTDRQNLAQEV